MNRQLDMTKLVAIATDRAAMPPKQNFVTAKKLYDFFGKYYRQKIVNKKMKEAKEEKYNEAIRQGLPARTARQLGRQAAIEVQARYDEAKLLPHGTRLVTSQLPQHQAKLTWYQEDNVPHARQRQFWRITREELVRLFNTLGWPPGVPKQICAERYSRAKLMDIAKPLFRQYKAHCKLFGTTYKIFGLHPSRLPKRALCYVLSLYDMLPSASPPWVREGGALRDVIVKPKDQERHPATRIAPGIGINVGARVVMLRKLGLWDDDAKAAVDARAGDYDLSPAMMDDIPDPADNDGKNPVLPPIPGVPNNMFDASNFHPPPARRSPTGRGQLESPDAPAAAARRTTRRSRGRGRGLLESPAAPANPNRGQLESPDAPAVAAATRASPNPNRGLLDPSPPATARQTTRRSQRRGRGLLDPSPPAAAARGSRGRGRRRDSLPTPTPPLPVLPAAGNGQDLNSLDLNAIAENLNKQKSKNTPVLGQGGESLDLFPNNAGPEGQTLDPNLMSLDPATVREKSSRRRRSRRKSRSPPANSLDLLNQLFDNSTPPAVPDDPDDKEQEEEEAESVGIVSPLSMSARNSADSRQNRSPVESARTASKRRSRASPRDMAQLRVLAELFIANAAQRTAFVRKHGSWKLKLRALLRQFVWNMKTPTHNRYASEYEPVAIDRLKNPYQVWLKVKKGDRSETLKIWKRQPGTADPAAEHKSAQFAHRHKFGPPVSLYAKVQHGWVAMGYRWSDSFFHDISNLVRSDSPRALKNLSTDTGRRLGNMLQLMAKRSFVHGNLKLEHIVVSDNRTNALWAENFEHSVQGPSLFSQFAHLDVLTLMHSLPSLEAHPWVASSSENFTLVRKFHTTVRDVLKNTFPEARTSIEKYMSDHSVRNFSAAVTRMYNAQTKRLALQFKTG